MKRKQEIIAVYAAGVIQGITLVAFPAVSDVLTSSGHFALSTTEYGGMFIPQAITAILASFLGAGLSRHLGSKRIFLLGLLADLISMLLLFGSRFAIGDHLLAYGILLTATGFLGIGFGLAVPAVNTFAAAFFPKNVDRALLSLNALLGLGTALAPVFAMIFVGLKIWWGLPVLMSVLTIALLLFSARLPLDQTPNPSNANSKSGANKNANSQTQTAKEIPTIFWLYAAFALLYGLCETMNGNWAAVYLTKNLGASVALGSVALTVFWGSVTGGRILFAFVEKWIPQRWTYRLIPLLMAAAFFAMSFVPKTDPLLAVIAFGVAGLGCSALLPLVISFGQTHLAAMSASVAGALIGFYEIGYGLAAFGVGPLKTWANLDLVSIYRGMPILALALATLAFISVRHFQKTNG